jgi:phosphoadenosine phosphosulfate reductase
MLRELQLDGSIYDKTSIAIERIKTMAPIAESIYGEYTVMVSGGKDSTVITDLAIRSGVKCRFETSWTGVEYPETVYFLRREKARIEALGYSFEFIIPRDKNGKQITMWKLIEKKGFPTWEMRFCCAELKEFAGQNAYCIFGIRWAESKKRKDSRFIHEIARYKLMTNNDNEATRRMSENCMKKNKYMLNPIIEWSDDEVWEYIKERGIPYNPLYDMGHKRVGCIGCPMRANKKELADNPKWATLYKRAAQKYLENGATKRDGIKKDIETYFNWWVNFIK